jgi:hypothetical protein
LVDFKDKRMAGHLLGTYRGISHRICERGIAPTSRSIFGVGACAKAIQMKKLAADVATKLKSQADGA